MATTNSTGSPADQQKQAALEAIGSGGGSSGSDPAPVVDSPIGVRGATYRAVRDSAGNTHYQEMDPGYRATGGYDPRYRMGDSVGSMPLDSSDQPYAIRPGYFQGSEYELIQNMMPEKIKPIQDAMVRAGLMKGEFNYGNWDDASAVPFRRVLQYANVRGFKWEDALDELSSDANLMDRFGKPIGGGGSGLPKRAPFAAQLENPEDLKKVFQQVLYNTMGGNFSDDPGAADKFVQAYQDVQTKAQRSHYDAAVSGGATTDAPTDSVFAADQMKAADPNGAKAEKFMGYGNVLESLIGSGGKSAGSGGGVNLNG
jgi:hypothetical protein